MQIFSSCGAGRAASWALALVVLAAAAGCASPDADDGTAASEAEELNVEAAEYSARVVIPEIGWSWGARTDGKLAIEIEARTGGFLGLGAEVTKSTGPLIAMGRDLYGANGTLRIGRDMNVYLTYLRDSAPELYCCLGSVNPPRRDDGVYGGESPLFPDAGSEGAYVVGRIVGLSDADLKHGTELAPDQLVLDPGLTVAASRRIQSGARQLTLEAAEPPVRVATPTDLAFDSEAAARHNASLAE